MTYDLVERLKNLTSCTKCPLLGKDHVGSSGPLDAKIMLVGQSPGETEVQIGSPFVGPSGDLVTYMLDEAGIDRDTVYITNALKCRPPGNRAGHEEELDNCLNTFLKLELKEVNPKLLVLLGRDAWKTVTGGKIDFYHGKITTTRKGKKIMTAYHPAYFIRRGEYSSFIKIGALIREALNA